MSPKLPARRSRLPKYLNPLLGGARAKPAKASNARLIRRLLKGGREVGRGFGGSGSNHSTSTAGKERAGRPSAHSFQLPNAKPRLSLAWFRPPVCRLLPCLFVEGEVVAWGGGGKGMVSATKLTWKSVKIRQRRQIKQKYG